MMTDANTLFIAGRQIDIGTCCKDANVDKSKYCMPVLFSTKDGDELLKLCENPETHGGLDSSFHRPWKGFNRNALYKKYSKVATADQMKQANWTVLNKKPAA